MKALRRSNGQGLTEYLVIVALVAIASVAVIRVLGQNLSARFANVAFVLQGNGNDRSARFDQVEDSHYRKKDFSDFFKGTSSSDK
ncbi:MAG: hypothetical protein COT74_07255 [Bdellovibrionales bacterium CG10_big_fil_rev_8_21_14_0_10_45_34]|nr:MAG: hypothetical protein COT74_07255 [Bdellovibrionales bacterium CG10_big_fil_rev_8_21_14_0_10_45_34]